MSGHQGKLSNLLLRLGRGVAVEAVPPSSSEADFRETDVYKRDAIPTVDNRDTAPPVNFELGGKFPRSPDPRQIGSIENGVLTGNDGVLFLAGGAHNVFEIVTRRQEIPEHSYSSFENNITSRAAWAEANNVPYLHMIFPDKQSIIPESWPLGSPLKLGEQYLKRLQHLNLPIVYPAKMLADHKEQSISKIDTHVTAYGSILIAAYIVETMTGDSQEIVVNRLLSSVDTEEERLGDLGSKLNPPASASERVFSTEAPGKWLHNNLQGGNNGLVDLRYFEAAPYSKRLVLFGDSFGREMARYLQFWFREVVFLRSGFFHSDVAQSLDPDLLVTENVERYLDNCIPDDERPSFFMYPSLSGVPYCPSAEFANAFSVMLSPRRARHGELCNHKTSEFTPNGHHTSLRIPDAFLLGPLRLIDGPPTRDVLGELEAVQVIDRHQPKFRLNLSGREFPEYLGPLQDIHSSNLVERHDMLLLGSNVLVDDLGHWACESRAFKQQFLDLIETSAFQNSFPGPKPRIFGSDALDTLDFSAMETRDIIRVEEPVFLATPLEPANWGRWMVTVLPKLAQFREHGQGRKLLCYVGLRWQRDLLIRFGISEFETMSHDPGRTYFCSDVMTVDYNVANITVSQKERSLFASIREDSLCRILAAGSSRGSHERIFVSRMSTSARHPNYRVLQNEQELAEALTGLAFHVLEPEMLSFDEQVAAFANAEIVVCLGGAALYNTVFCKPGTKVITIESGDMFLRAHTNLLSSLYLDYGVITGRQDESDLTPVHKRWSIDVPVTCDQVRQFIDS